MSSKDAEEVFETDSVEDTVTEEEEEEENDEVEHEDAGSSELVGWFADGDRKFQTRSPYISIPWRQLVTLPPFLYRYSKYWYRKRKRKTLPFIDNFRPLKQKAIYGVPCGGIGSGSIGRGFRGEFCKFALRPGLVEHNVVPANQFIVCVRKNEQTEYIQCLTADKAHAANKTKGLSAWSFRFPASCMKYRGLFPRSWTHYDLPSHDIKMTCRQVSPVFPNNYKDTTLPVVVFIWDISSNHSEALDVSITFTFRNGVGNSVVDKNGQCSSNSFQLDSLPFWPKTVRGVQLRQKISDMDCIISLSGVESDVVELSSKTRFDPTGTGTDLWTDLLNSGDFSSDTCSTSGTSDGTLPQLGVGLCAKVKLEPGQSKKIELCLCWDMPQIQFGKKGRKYFRRYSQWFGRDLTAGPKISQYALSHYHLWEDHIDSWQKPVIEAPHLPEWYKSALFNELYYVVDGGSTWVDFDEQWPKDEPHLSPYTISLLKEYGRFAYLESWEYRMFNTYDVHFYASFALAMLWPKLEQTLQAEFADLVFHEDKRCKTFHCDGDRNYVKKRGRVPHDLGNPASEPWLNINCYRSHDTSKWRDLNLKFVLQTFRDYLVLGEDKEFLRHSWKAIKSLIQTATAEWDLDQDGMIENSDTCDQTYDSWSMHGTSAYCGGLWLGALRVAQEIAGILHDPDKSLYQGMLSRAKEAYSAKLWTGQYFKFDESNDTVMADQLCGIWYLSMCGFANSVVSNDQTLSSLKIIFDTNVCKFKNGQMGAVNGMKPDGKADRSNLQALEVWTAVSYTLASHMILQGMTKEGFQTAKGVYSSCYGQLGLQYQTPEAYYEAKWFRACGYMRPLAVWAIQWAINRTSQPTEE